jgi:Fe-S-cluster containining protein
METAPDGGGTVPVELTEPFDYHRVVMRGTNRPHPRCVCLMGIIGARVHCRIYEQRSSVCRAFPVAWENGAPNEGCDRARRAWGLAPLKPPWHHRPGHWPRAA